MASPRALLLAVVLVLPGCSGGETLAPVTGSVTVGGKPAVGASVMFHPDGPADVNTVVASGRVGADGTFTLRTGDRDGAKAGKYVVTIRWPDPDKKLSDAQKMMGASQDDASDLLRGRYDTKDKSNIRAEVVPGPNTLKPFELTR